MSHLGPQAHPPEPLTALTAVKTSLLLVDDRPEDLTAMEVVLADLGQTLIKASSGREALRFAAEQDFAVILLDIRMPELDGIATAALLRKLERSKRVPILFVTAADPSPVQLAEAYSVGAVDFIPKPLDAGILRTKVSAFVSLAQANGELQRRAREAVRTAEERLRLLAEQMPVAAWTADPELRITFCAGAWYHAEGRRPEDYIGKPLPAFNPPREGREHPGIVAHRRALAGEPVTYELEAMDRIYQVTVRPHLDPQGRIVGTVAGAFDVSALKRLEESQRFLAEASRALSSSLDYEATLATVARLSAARLSDWCTIHLREDGAPPRLVAAEHADPARRQAMREYWARYPADPAHLSSIGVVLDSGQSLFVPLLAPAQIHAAAQDPEHLALIREAQPRSLMIVPLRVRDRVLGAITFVRGAASRAYDAADLSAAEDLAARAALAIENARLYRAAEREIAVRKRAEEDVRVLNADLERRVEERTRALQETMSELDTFVQSVSHDLKTPIRAVLSLSQLLLEEHADTLDPTARQHLNRIAETGLRMNRLVGDLLTLSRLGRTPPDLQPVELERVVDDVLRNLALEIEENHAKVSVSGPLPRVLGQAMPLGQAVTNLVSNALKFVAPGAAPRVAIGAEERDGRIRLWVEDHGIGVAAEDQASLFKAFARLASDQRFPGTGLGLAIVRKAVERMGGSAGVESAVGKGSRFWIELARA